MTVTKYPAKQNWAKVAKNLGLSEGLVYLKGDILKERHDTDVELTFRQESNFYYLTGFNEHNAHALYDLKTHQLTLLAYKLPDDHIVWFGNPPTESELLAKFDVDAVRWSTDLISTINSSSASALYVLREADVPKGISLPVNSTALKAAVVYARMFKSPFEIELMRKINHISSNAHVAVMKAAKKTQSETELDAVFRYETFRFGAKGQSYMPIVASGTDAATLHYCSNSKSFEGNHDQLCLVDAGAEMDCYASDITRTFPLNGKFSEDAKTLYRIVLEMQQTVMDLLKPGVEWEDMHRLAAKIGVQGLQKAGLLKSEYSVQEMLGQHVDGVFFPCGLGHMIGLDVHDVHDKQGLPPIDAPGIRYLRLRRVLEANFVVTVEPGLYFTESNLNSAKKDEKISKYMNWDVIERFSRLGGVRLEDCVVITETGIDNLTIVPREIEEIEALMASSSRSMLTG